MFGIESCYGFYFGLKFWGIWVIFYGKVLNWLNMWSVDILIGLFIVGIC